MKRHDPLDETTNRLLRRNGKTGHDQPPAPDPRGLITVCLADVFPQPIRWLVPNYLPLGKLVLLAGDGGHGKSTFTLSLTAAVSRGLPFLGLEYVPPLPPADVLLVSCEDDLGDTVVPRLIAAGADRSRVHHVTGIRTKDDKPAPFSLGHYVQVAEHLQDNPNIRLVVIDPAGAFIGRAGIDDHKDSELRSLLGPLAQIAADRRVTFILVKHLNRGAKPKAVDRVQGSTGYVNSVRSAFVICPDQGEEERKLLLPIKSNLTKKAPGIAYRLVPLDEPEQREVWKEFKHLDEDDAIDLALQLFHIKWEGTVTTSADDALSVPTGSEGGETKIEKAMAWLTEFLAIYAYPSQELVEAGKRAGFQFHHIKEAKDRLKPKGLRSTKRGFKDGWWCGFGDPNNWQPRPDENTSASSASSASSENPSEKTPDLPRRSGRSGRSEEEIAGPQLFDPPPDGKF